MFGEQGPGPKVNISLSLNVLVIIPALFNLQIGVKLSLHRTFQPRGYLTPEVDHLKGKLSNTSESRRVPGE